MSATVASPYAIGIALALACFVPQACDNSSPAERALVHTDAEIFETVAQSERGLGTADSTRSPRFLRIDSRPVENTSLLPSKTAPGTGIALDDDSAQLSSDVVERISRERRSILERLGLEEGGPFVFPGCGGVRTVDQQPESVAASRASCPNELRRYVTIGIPRRGIGQIPEKLRRPEPQAFDTGEVWTVLVTESAIGPGGQDWKQYAWVLARPPGRAELALAARFLLSWAE